MCTIPDYSKESKRHKWGHMNVGDLINCLLDLCRLPTISIFLQCDFDPPFLQHRHHANPRDTQGKHQDGSYFAAVKIVLWT